MAILAVHRECFAPLVFITLTKGLLKPLLPLWPLVPGPIILGNCYLFGFGLLIKYAHIFKVCTVQAEAHLKDRPRVCRTEHSQPVYCTPQPVLRILHKSVTVVNACVYDSFYTFYDGGVSQASVSRTKDTDR